MKRNRQIKQIALSSLPKLMLLCFLLILPIRYSPEIHKAHADSENPVHPSDCMVCHLSFNFLAEEVFSIETFDCPHIYFQCVSAVQEKKKKTFYKFHRRGPPDSYMTNG